VSNVRPKWKVPGLSAQLVCALPYLSVIAQTLSHFLNTSPTPFAAAFVYPLLFVVLPVLLTYPIRASAPVLLGLYFSGWNLIVLFFLSPLNSESLFRFTSLLWQVALMIFVATALDKDGVSVSKIFLNYGTSCATIVALSNLLYPSLGFSPAYFAFERYEGLFGPNAHGLISAIAAMAFISYASGRSYSKASRLLFAIIVCWLLANVWASGSRLSVLTVLAFLVIFSNKRLYRYLIFAILLAGSVVFIMLPNKETVLLLFRFDEYSFWGRVNPPLWGWQMARENYFQPYGFTTLREDILEQRLDSSFLIFLLEVGWIGTALLTGIITLTLVRCKFLERHLQTTEKAIDIRAIYATLVALCLHGLGENSLFTSSNVATLLFWTIIGAAHANHTSAPPLRHHRLSGRWGRDAVSTSR
jgi:hypothetical protein